jgi:hypothetical protein
MKSALDDIVAIEECTEQERVSIAEEANRILADPAFKNSRRCVALFRFLADRSLAREKAGIKERTLGVEVFGRAPDYDTAADPIVRITANEIRKRLAQWYQEPANHQQVRVRLVAGAYILSWEFIYREHPKRGPSERAEGRPETAEEVLATPDPLSVPFKIEPPIAPAVSGRFQTKWIWVSVAIFLTATAALSARHFETARSKDYLLWKPLLDSSQPLTLCISDSSRLVDRKENDSPLIDGKTDENSPNSIIAGVIASRQAPGDVNPRNPLSTTPLIDAQAAQKITAWLATHGKKSSLRGSSSVDLQDLRQGPIVLIGGFNPWSLIMLSNLRYSLRADPTAHEEWIQDAKNPSQREWEVRGGMEHVETDYAIITRFLDPETGKWILAFGGIRPYGTQVAADLLSDPSFIQSLPDNLRATGNMQIVLKLTVINRSAGPPQILTVYTW